MHCIDRQAMIDTLQFGQGVLLDAYVTSDHPLYPADAVSYGYDPALGNQLLDQAGFVDCDEDGIRDQVEVGAAVIRTPISITLGTDDFSPLRGQINAMVTTDLAACGVRIVPYQLPVADWYADGPFSPLFGRRFDLGTFAWLSRIEPPCNLYLTRNITGPEEEGFGGWRNLNATGWSNEVYDVACEAAVDEFWNTAVYQTGHQDALRIFTEELPMIPLFSRVDIVLLNPNVTGLQVDATQRLAFWNAAEINLLGD
jgi:peptide/nickel transport system substrate-binding protein